MAMAIALTSTSHASNYHVFLSFRGPDTRRDFTGNLYKALTDKGIYTFIDDEKLQRAKEITPELIKAIQGSKFAIIVLSKHYATSSFCLDELTTIIHFAQSKRLSVLPVFYMVDPSDVRHLRGSYEDALTEHEKRTPEKLQKWKEALRKVADLSGYHFKEGDEYEYKFIESIVDWVSHKINHPARLHVADYPVGLESRVAQVMKLLDGGSDDVGFDDGVYMVGIHGMGGVGKSTLARAVYNNLIAHNFDGFCYLENVREESEKHGLKHLQNILLRKILGDDKIQVTSVEEGAWKIPERLKRKKVLLVVDDVDKEQQLQKIVGSPELFGPGSRVIVTTRDQQLLACHQVKRQYELKELNEDDALQLLTWKVFKKEKADPKYVNDLNLVLTYASGLPLALVVIGSHLFGKSSEDWESAMNQYKRNLPTQIQEILKHSYDALQTEEKSVFLDIACCLKGYELQEVEAMLNILYDDNMKHHIGVLVDKSLIKVEWGIVKMHDLIQEMGRQIDKESHKKPEKRKRLWLWKDIIQVLKHNKGTSKIEIIYLDVPELNREEIIEWDGNGFKKMEDLKILIIKNGKFSEGPKSLPNSLRVLEWWGYPSNGLPSDFKPRNLVKCNLPDGCFTSFELVSSSEMFKNLTVLTFDLSKSLTQIPDLSNFPNLEKLSFRRCANLVTVHESIGRLGKVKEINAWGCKNLLSFPPIQSTSLENLQLSITGLESFPEISGQMENMKQLFLNVHRIRELPISFEKMLGNITSLDFYGCKSLAHIPDLSNFLNLEKLSFEWCDDLVTVHESVGRLDKLKKINAWGCKKLVSFPPIHLTSLDDLSLSNTGLKSFPEISGKMENIRRLELEFTRIKEFPISFVNLVRLQELSVLGSGSVVKLPISILMMSQLTHFVAEDWEGMKWVKEEDNEETMNSTVSSKLYHLEFQCCNLDDDFFSIINFTRFVSVTYLDLSGNNFTFLPDCIKEFQSLRHLNVSYCEHLHEIRGVPPNIQYFDAKNCKSLTSSSTSMLINKELYEAGMRRCCLPGEWIPEWFDHHKSSGASTCFWFRNKLPTKILCLLVAPVFYIATPMVLINGNDVNSSFHTLDFGWTGMDHTCILELDLKWRNLPEEALRKEWNQVEVTFVNVMENLDIKATGIHVLKGESGMMEDIGFSDPICRKRKLDNYL